MVTGFPDFISSLYGNLSSNDFGFARSSIGYVPETQSAPVDVVEYRGGTSAQRWPAALRTAKH